MNQDTPQNQRFVRLFAVNEPAIRSFVRKMVPRRDDVCDVIQDVAVVLWRKFDPSCGDLDFRKFAFSVAHYEVLAWRRDRARDRHLLDEDVLMALAEECVETEDLLAAQREALKTCMEKLTNPQRKLLLAAYGAKGSVQQLAQQSGRSTQGIYQWLYRMRIMLLACVRKTAQGAVS